MIDKIIDLSKNNNQIEIDNLEQEVISSNNALYIYAYAYYFSNRDLSKLNKTILETNNQTYIMYYFNNIKNIDEEEFLRVILEFDCKTIFYSLFGRKNASDKSYIKAYTKLLEYPEDTYKNLLIYNYFVVLNKYNQELLDLVKKQLPNLAKDNYKELLTKLINDYSFPIKKHEGYSQNIYKGHKGYKSDIIVCHRSFDYGRIIDNFYSDKAQVSAHFATSKTGEYLQFLSLDDSPWSNGTTDNPESGVYYRHSNNPLIYERGGNANYYTYSIENETFDGTLTEPQYQSVLKIAKQIIDYHEEKYHEKFIIDNKHIIGHINVSPLVRATCPGSNFPLERLIKDLQDYYK
jgi:N-acetyl-anhydromuramyl-L-alanine amidase AmpD